MQGFSPVYVHSVTQLISRSVKPMSTPVPSSVFVLAIVITALRQYAVLVSGLSPV